MHLFAYIKKLFFLKQQTSRRFSEFILYAYVVAFGSQAKNYRSLTAEVKEAKHSSSSSSLVKALTKCRWPWSNAILTTTTTTTTMNDEMSPMKLKLKSNQKDETTHKKKKQQHFDSIFLIRMLSALHARVFLFLRKMSGVLLLFIIFVYLMFDLGFMVVHCEMSKLWSPLSICPFKCVSWMRITGNSIGVLRALYAAMERNVFVKETQIVRNAFTT